MSVPASSPGPFSVMAVSKELETELLLFKRRFQAALWQRRGGEMAWRLSLSDNLQVGTGLEKAVNLNTHSAGPIEMWESNICSQEH